MEPRSRSSLDANPAWVTAAMHLVFFLTGMGALLLASMLPWLAAAWHLRDQQAGVLIGAQFLGSFVGATTLRPGLKAELAWGVLAIPSGFFALAVSAQHHNAFRFGVVALLIAGFGLGRSITAINLLASARFRRHRGSALSLLNLTWGVGAVCAPAFVALAATTVGTAGVAFAFPVAFVLCTGIVWRSLQDESGVKEGSPDSLPIKAGLVYFGIVFLLYGGLESSVTGWIGLLTTRSAGGTIRGGALATTSLWLGLTSGRALASLLLLRMREVSLLRAGFVLAAAGVLLLARAGEHQLIALAFAIGFGLAPAFAGLCSLLLIGGRHPRHAGGVMATASLGGVLFPYLVGLISDRSGSLRWALAIPCALSGALFLLLGHLSSHRGDS